MKESIKQKKDRIERIILRLKDIYPDAKIQLNFSTHFDLLVATILSSQCTDNRVNIVTKDLFTKYKTPQDYLNISIEELEKEIFSTGFYKAKAKHIKQSAEVIINDFNGNVPIKMVDLLKLPGVGRKTANVILGHCFNVPSIVVDTHVIRLSNRMGFVNTENADKIEFELMKIIKEYDWVLFTHLFILHGREICKSRNPKCYNCVINSDCFYNFKILEKYKLTES